MRTNIELDDILLADAMRLTGISVKRAVVELALRSLVEQRTRLSLLDLRGQIDFDPSYDYKAGRAGRTGQEAQ